jgi:hypothetical protein
MGDDSKNNNKHTTNEDYQREAARLKKQLRQNTTSEQDEPDKTVDSSTSTAPSIPNVEIAEKAHKYMLISAKTPAGDQRQHFVASKRGAHYHCNAAKPWFVYRLDHSGYKSIDVKGGGRTALDSANQTIAVYGYSYVFGLADHALSKAVILSDPRY